MMLIEKCYRKIRLIRTLSIAHEGDFPARRGFVRQEKNDRKERASDALFSCSRRPHLWPKFTTRSRTLSPLAFWPAGQRRDRKLTGFQNRFNLMWNGHVET